MILSRRYKLILAAWAIAFAAWATGVNVDIYRLTIADDLPSNTVFDVWQDPRGYMWFATKNGVSRYDSYSMVNYTRHSNVGTLVGDTADNLLWYVHDATYGAIDLNTFRYVGYGQADSARTFTKSVAGHGGLWAFDHERGARFIFRDGNHLSYRDYNVRNRKLASDAVRRIRVDDDGKAWISTAKGIYMVDTLGNVKCLSPHMDSPDNVIVRDKVCFLDKRQRICMFTLGGKPLKPLAVSAALSDFSALKYVFLWNRQVVIGSKDRLCVFRPDERRITALGPHGIHNGTLIDQFDGNSFVQDKDFNLWIFSKHGNVRKLALVPDGKFTHAHPRKYVVRPMKDGRLAIGTYGNGLFVYNSRNGDLRHFTADEKSPMIASNYIERLFVDAQGSLWVNEAFLGISCISKSHNPAVNFSFADAGNHGDWSNNICMVAAIKNGDAMVGTHDNKLYRLDGKLHNLSFVGDLNAPAYGYYEDAQGHRWLGTRGDGLYVDGVRYATDEPVHKVPCNDFYCFVGDKKGNIWIGTPDNGLLQTRYEKGKPLKFRQYLKRSHNESYVSGVDVDRSGTLWIASANGLYRLDPHVRNITDDSFTLYNRANKNYPYDVLTFVRCMDDGSLWTSSFGKGICRSRLADDGQTLVNHEISAKDGLANNNVNDLIDDRHGRLWASTDNGFSVISKKSLKVLSYPLSPSAEQNITVNRCAALLSDHTVAFGTLYGVALLNTQGAPRMVEKTASPIVTDLWVNGKSILDNDGMPDFRDGIRLSHDNNSLTFHFSNFDFTGRRHTLYQCYLEGTDNTWRSPTTANTVEYGNLPSGTYVLHMRAWGGDNQWGKETTFKVVILPPWYNTWWAWLVYVVIIAFMAWYVWRNWKDKFDLRQQMKMEKQLADFRIDFFTHVTHEFRTPLAIIQNAVGKIVSADGQQVSRTNIQTAKRGTRRLLRLVNQLMEFRRISTRNIRLEVERADIVAFVRSIYQDFWMMAKQKEQIITFTPFGRSYEMLFDRHVVETVVYNLLSNAVKYTPMKGRISLKMKCRGDGLHITCEDDGPGISTERKRELFQPFMHGYVSQGGMGIGLYTAHEMALKHHGNLILLDHQENDMQGRLSGAAFDFVLPLDEKVYAADEYRTTQTASEEKTEEKEAEMVIMEMQAKSLNDVRVAVIEDDADMMAQLKAELGVYFHVDGYMDGRTGYEGVCAHRPALLVCDVMLPGCSGYDIVKKLKRSDEFFDIPVIMLTALDDDSHKLKGYDAGADDYMVKPCNFKLLTARIVQLISWYRKFKPCKAGQTKDQQPVPKVETTVMMEGGKETRLVTSIADHNFLNNMQAIVAQHIGDKDFTIDQLASQLCMGRTKFYGKVKDLLGVSPNKYISNERMRIAGKLILEGRLTIAEVGYQVGIIDPSYFNKCFKAYYGCVPSKYGK